MKFMISVLTLPLKSLAKILFTLQTHPSLIIALIDKGTFKSKKKKYRYIKIKQLLRYGIDSIKRPGRLLNFWTSRVGTYSRWMIIQVWVLIKFSPFLTSSNFILQQNNK